MRGLEGRCALVTGAASGIGRAIAQRLAEEGARVAVSDLSRHDAEATAADLGEPAIGVELDISSDDSIRRGVDEVQQRLGPIDVLVNNAGWDLMEPFLDSKPETWDRVLAVNLRGPIAVTQAVLESMVERGAGRIVSIASDAGRVGSSGEAVYSGAKAGIMGFSRTDRPRGRLPRDQREHGVPRPDQHAAAARDDGDQPQAGRRTVTGHPVRPARRAFRDRCRGGVPGLR